MLMHTPKPRVRDYFEGASALPDEIHMKVNMAEPITSVRNAPNVVIFGLGARTISISLG